MTHTLSLFLLLSLSISRSLSLSRSLCFTRTRIRTLSGPLTHRVVINSQCVYVQVWIWIRVCVARVVVYVYVYVCVCVCVCVCVGVSAGATQRRLDVLRDENRKKRNDGHILAQNESQPTHELLQKENLDSEILVQTVNMFFQQHGGESGAAVVSLSGGVDSMVLCQVLYYLRDRARDQGGKGRGGESACGDARGDNSGGGGGDFLFPGRSTSRRLIGMCHPNCRFAARVAVLSGSLE
mmetsp:Transcript_62478/g.91560  ORF Transcript_62478/g.91560 Transcript_62478/m.91560 type:complete len:238 (+) Transcript_62478:495-1208(+)